MSTFYSSCHRRELYRCFSCDNKSFSGCSIFDNRCCSPPIPLALSCCMRACTHMHIHNCGASSREKSHIRPPTHWTRCLLSRSVNKTWHPSSSTRRGDGSRGHPTVRGTWRSSRRRMFHRCTMRMLQRKALLALLRKQATAIAVVAKAAQAAAKGTRSILEECLLQQQVMVCSLPVLLETLLPLYLLPPILPHLHLQQEITQKQQTLPVVQTKELQHSSSTPLQVRCHGVKRWCA